MTSNAAHSAQLTFRLLSPARLILLALCSIWLGGAVDTSRGDGPTTTPSAPRSSAQIVAELRASEKANFLALEVDRLEPRRVPSPRDRPLLQMIDLISELERVDPASAAAWRRSKCLLLTRMALYGHKDALQSLNNSAGSAVPSEALFGKISLIIYRWCDSADAATQQGVVKEFAALAKASPREDLLFYAALRMAIDIVAPEDVARSLRRIADEDLTCPDALQFRRQPVKIGWPYKATVQTIGGKQVSTADWQGKVVIIDFWATWCPACMANMAELIELYQKDHPLGLEILGIANDRLLPDVKQYMAAHKEMVWPQSFNPSGPQGLNALWYRNDYDTFPCVFLIDRTGILRDVDINRLDVDLIARLVAEPVPLPPTSAQSASRPPDASDLDDSEANSLLSLANSYIAANRPDRAKDKLNQLLSKYPSSTAASKAKALLAQLGG